VLPVAEIRAALPTDHPIIDAATRRRELAKRSEAAWNRFQ
jgi:hypothetical protein